jgi:hypothetical protein
MGIGLIMTSIYGLNKVMSRPDESMQASQPSSSQRNGL